MSTSKLQIRENSPKDSIRTTKYKRPFKIEKFLKDLHSSKLIDYVNNKDPLIERRKELKKIKILSKIKIMQNEKKDSNFHNKTPFLQLIPNSQNFDMKSSERVLNSNFKKKLIKQRSDFDLPIISRQRIEHKNRMDEAEKTTMTFFNNSNIISNNNQEEKIEKKLITSEMIKSKDLYNNTSRKLSVCSFMNKLPGDKSLIENYKIIDDINIINDRYNLKLNLNDNKSDSTSKIFEGKKYNINGMLNKLYQYYSSETNNSIFKNKKYAHSINYRNSSSNLNTIENKIYNKYENSDLGSNNTIEVIKNTYEDESNTFLTKLNSYSSPAKKENKFDITGFIRTRCSLSEINRYNEQIINDNKKVGLHCLLSKKQRDINLKKILYKYIDKSIYELEKDPIYIKIKELEKNIIKILKK